MDTQVNVTVDQNLKSIADLAGSLNELLSDNPEHVGAQDIQVVLLQIALYAKNSQILLTGNQLRKINKPNNEILSDKFEIDKQNPFKEFLCTLMSFFKRRNSIDADDIKEKIRYLNKNHTSHILEMLEENKKQKHVTPRPKFLG